MVKRTVDPKRFRSALEKLARRDLLVVLDRALAHVPKHRLGELVDGFIAFDELVAVGSKKRVRVIDKVKAFHEASLRGEYYESFNVNSKNFMEKSAGTEEWIAECERLLEDVLRLSGDGDPAEVREAFELLFALLRRVDDGEDDIIFFADEGGSWQVGVDWLKVLPAYFRCLAATAPPEGYARIATAVIDDFVPDEASRYLSRARGAATRGQKAAMKVLLQAVPRRGPKG
jgi:hypothetical protein